ncbi:MAG: hypothetical protein Tsb0020_12880 [Haliangiales bacterium]
MPRIRLNPTWTKLMHSYDADHQDPRNQACHKVGIPLIAGSLPVGATIVGLPLAAAMFTTGWAFQFVGHAFEGKQPSFVSDKRALAVGVLWWLKKAGLDIELAEDAAASDAAAAGSVSAEAA